MFTTVDELKKLVTESEQGIKDVLILMVPQAVMVLAGFVTTILITRGLGPAALGEYALVLSVSGVAAALSDLGIGQTAIRYASRAISHGERAEQLAILRWAFRLRIALVLIVTVLFAVMAPFLAESVWHSPDLAHLIRIGLLSGLFTAIASVPSVYFQSNRKFSKNAAVLIAQAMISLSGVVLVAVLNLWSVEAVLIVSVIASALGALVFLLSIPTNALASRSDFSRADRSFLRSYWQSPVVTDGMADGNTAITTFAFYNVLSTVVIMVHLRVDIWLLGYFVDQSQIGIYTAGSRFAVPLSIVLAAISTALWPRASTQTGPEQAMAFLFKTLRLSSIVGGAAALYAIVFPVLAPLLFGEAYRGSVLLGQLLSLRYAFAILIYPIAVVGYSLGLIRIYWIINLVQLSVVVALCIVLVPAIGPLGSAIALLANEVVGVSVLGTAIWHKTRQLRKQTPGTR